ncbi:uncharacterized protein [Triticum aestivum]|uniref:uncharacterized protein n=1 Tax=Triticum aestivum TaxID=4565 RepID=UPI001D00385B|nr:uncharacterized protein LOC123121080 [Triticum aestivum]
MEKEAVLDIEQGVLDELESSIQRPDIDFCLLCPKPLETQTVLVVEGEDPKWICEDCEADLQQAPDPVLEPQGQGAVPVNVDGVFYDRAALEQHQAIWARLQVELEMAAIRTKERHRGGPPPPPPPPPPGGCQDTSSLNFLSLNIPEEIDIFSEEFDSNWIADRIAARETDGWDALQLWKMNGSRRPRALLFSVRQ